MERSPLKATNESGVKPNPGGTLDFDDGTLKAIAEVYKNEGNDEYRRKEFSSAIYFYTEGIKVNCKDDELSAKLYSNRATAHFYSGNYRESLDDARAATELQPTYVKAIARAAFACVELHHYEDAINWCDKGLAIKKNNKTLLDLRTSCVDELNKLQETDPKKVAGRPQTERGENQKISDELSDRNKEGIDHIYVGNADHDIRVQKAQKVISYLELQLKAAKETGDRIGEGKACSYLGVIYHLVDLERAIDYHKLHLKIAKELGDRPGEGCTYGYLGDAYYRLSDFKKAIHYHELRLQISKEIMDRTGEGIAYGNIGISYHGLSDYEKAITYHKLHLGIAKEDGHTEGEGNAYGNLGTCYHSLGNFIKAKHYHELQLKIAKEIKDKTLEGMALGSLGNVYRGLGDLRKALIYHRLYLNNTKEMQDKDGEGRACGLVGDTYLRLGDFKKAIDFNERYLHFVREERDKAGEGYASSNLGVVYGSLGDFDKAIEYHELSLKKFRELGNRDGEGRACGNLGNTYIRRGDFRKAIDYHKRDLKITKEVGNRAGEGSANGNLGTAYADLGDFKKAMHYHQLSLEISKDVGDRVGQGTAYNNLGNTYYRQGDIKCAMNCYECRLEIAKETGDRNGEAQAYGNLGNVYGNFGDFEKAICCYELHLSIAKEVGDKDWEGSANGSLGSLYNSLGDFKKAIHYHELHLKIAREVGNRATEGRAYCNLGNVYCNLGNHQKAIDCHELHLSIAKELGEKVEEGDAYGCLGSEYHCLGDLKKAVFYHDLHLKIARQIGHRAGEGRALCNLGIVYGQLGYYQKAINCHEIHLRIAKELADTVGMAITYNGLGSIFESLGSLQKAREYYQSSVKIFNNITVGRLSKDELKISLRDMYQTMYTNLWSLLLKQDKVVDALLAAEQGRAQALKYLMKLKYRLGTSFLQPSPVEGNIHELLNCLPTNTVFLAVDQRETVFWVIRNGKDVTMRRKEAKDNKPCNDWTKFFESLVDIAYDEIGVGADVKCEDRSLDKAKDEEGMASVRSDQKRSHLLHPPTSALRSLYDAIIGPIADLVTDNELIIVPDGPLCLAPFAAFVDCHSKFLSKSFRIRVIPSLTSLKLIADCPGDYHCKSGALLVGDPWVQEVTNADGKVLLEQLPGAREEVERIGEIVKTVPLTGTEATKDEVLKRLPSVALVHIAAHGRMETGEIALSPNSFRSSQVPEEKDFLLTMRDVLNVQLRARLVVLSCCHSGRGEIKAEGVVGIARAFLGAGARSVLVSLWAIDDEATLEFMKTFYMELMKGRSAGEALSQAIKWMRESEMFSEVKYWAPFVLIGDDVTLEFDEND